MLRIERRGKMRWLSRKPVVIDSVSWVRALAHGGRVYHCQRCDERMFVKPESGLCPVCSTRIDELALDFESDWLS
jgi:hypothetical protein